MTIQVNQIRLFIDSADSFPIRRLANEIHCASPCHLSDSRQITKGKIRFKTSYKILGLTLDEVYFRLTDTIIYHTTHLKSG